MRLFLVSFAGLVAMAFLQIDGRAGEDVLKEKIVRETLNHNEPAVVKVGTNGVTSLEFPYRIEAIDGFGFSQTPGSEDVFQISYTKGTNYFSVRALKPGATGNLTVVLDQKVYSFFFEESSNPTFVNIFAPGSEGGWAATGEREIAEKDKVATSAQLAGLLDKVKDYAALRSSSPEIFDGLQVAEPGKKIRISSEVESTIRRVLKDDSLNSAAFEVEINNRSTKDFWYDPQKLQVRVKDQVYGPVVQEAAGMVRAQTGTTIFFVVTEAGSARQSDLAPGDDFGLVISESPELSTEGLAFSQPPGNYLPTAASLDQAWQDPETRLGEGKVTNQQPPPAPSPAKRTSSKKAVKKPNPKSDLNAKESIAKTQKPLAKKLFGWL
jgi:hypothetical protein